MRNAFLAALTLAMLSQPAWAKQTMDDDTPPPDARTEGYARDDVKGGTPEPLVIDPPTGSAGTWALTVICGAICIGVLFKNGKRTHLD